MKTGGWNTPWVMLERPKPPKVDDRYGYWTDPPSEVSARCLYWLRQIERGWRPNTHLRRMGYDEASEWYGVYLWEYLNVLMPRLAQLRSVRSSLATPAAHPQ